MKILCQDQYDLNWWSLRRGKPTSSNAAKIVTPKQKKYSTSSRKYIYDLVGDLYDPDYPRTDGFQSAAMKNGHEREQEARKWFSFKTDLDVVEVGLVSNQIGEEGDEDYKAPTFWGSPDAMVEETNEPVEIKAPTPGVHLSYLWDNKVPDDYIAQLHGHTFGRDRPGTTAQEVVVQGEGSLEPLRDDLPVSRLAAQLSRRRYGEPQLVELAQDVELALRPATVRQSPQRTRAVEARDHDALPTVLLEADGAVQVAFERLGHGPRG